MKLAGLAVLFQCLRENYVGIGRFGCVFSVFEENICVSSSPLSTIVGLGVMKSISTIVGLGVMQSILSTICWVGNYAINILNSLSASTVVLRKQCRV